MIKRSSRTSDNTAALIEKLRKELAEIKTEEQKWLSILRQTSDYIFVVNKKGQVEYVNHLDTGFQQKDVVGANVLDFVESETKEKINAAMDAVFIRGESSCYTSEMIHPDGRLHYYSNSVSPLQQNGEITGMILVSKDVTPENEAKQKIQELSKNLKFKIQERTAQLQAANKELESFSYSVSHDLRAPLRAITGFSKILIEGYHDKLDKEGKQVANTIIESAAKMGTLIGDILDFSRLDKSELKSVNIDMKAVSQDVYNDLMLTEGERKIEFKLQEIPNAYGDFGMIRQVMFNLLSNALKFTRNTPKAIIEVGLMETNQERNTYFVKDNGAGFDIKDAEKIFDVFQRVHHEDEFEGTGVGLAIAKRVINRHSGEIWAESKVGKGAIFFFTLPGREK